MLASPGDAPYSLRNTAVTISPHKTLNSCRGVISEPDLLTTPETEVLEGFSDQGVLQWLATLTAVPESLGSNPREGMEVCTVDFVEWVYSKCSSCTTSPLVRLVEEEDRREAPDPHLQGVLPQL
ncbi:hypothetical protein TNCV_682931 [Trichonephila clavipes]|nr:hypothetical protein TNCV_682931 [Trichonephila clavipes]